MALYVMIGIPGSGKSTWAKANKKEKDIYVSRDEVRFSLLRDGDEYFSKEKEVLKEFYRQINEGLKQQKNVYVDATHLNKKSRDKLLNNLQIDCPVIGVYVATSLKVALERNEKRSGRSYVPPQVIKDMYNKLTLPTKEEKFDRVIKISTF